MCLFYDYALWCTIVPAVGQKPKQRNSLSGTPIIYQRLMQLIESAVDCFPWAETMQYISQVIKCEITMQQHTSDK